MRKFVAYVASGVLMAALAGCGTVQASTAASTSHPAAAVAGPQLQLTSPKTGTSLSGSSVTVSFTTKNITLVNPATHPTDVKGEGHVHLYLDQRPVVMIHAHHYTFTGLKPGVHHLKVELVTNTMVPYPHTPVTVSFTTHGTPSATKSSGSKTSSGW